MKLWAHVFCFRVHFKVNETRAGELAMDFTHDFIYDL